MNQLEKEVMIKSTAGLHAQLAVKLVQVSSQYSVDIKLVYKDKTIDIKSILGLMSLAIPKGENVRIIASGERANEAINEIMKVLR